MYYSQVMPFYLVTKNCGSEGYKMGDPRVDPNVDVDEFYRAQAQGQREQMAEVLRSTGAVPGGPATYILKPMGDNGFLFIHHGDFFFIVTLHVFHKF